MRLLAARGADAHVGHDAANLPDDVNTVVHTGAIWPENPEFLLAKERGLHVIHRSQALHWLIGGRRLISVAGAHGKTTSTGMIVTALQALGEVPTFVNGSVIAGLGVSSADRLRRHRRHRSGRVRWHISALRHGGRPDHQRRSRPHGSLGFCRGLLRRIRALRRGRERSRRHLSRRCRRAPRCRSPEHTRAS